MIGSWDPTKCLASSSANSSGEAMPCSRANAYTAFFCESVGSAEVLSPDRKTASSSPASATLTLRSRSSWAGPSRVTRTTLVSALPY